MPAKTMRERKAIRVRCEPTTAQRVALGRYAGKNLVPIDRWFPSSKLCGTCGQVNDGLELSDRIWVCPCGAEHDRDLNAAGNIRTEGLRHVAVGGTETLNACGGHVRPPKVALAREAGTPQRGSQRASGEAVVVG